MDVDVDMVEPTPLLIKRCNVVVRGDNINNGDDVADDCDGEFIANLRFCTGKYGIVFGIDECGGGGDNGNCNVDNGGGEFGIKIFCKRLRNV